MMEKTNLNPRQSRQRKFLCFAPLFVWPMFSLLFWAGGGGKDARAKATPGGTGFDENIPGVHLPNQKGWTKEDYYKQARQDSLAQAERERTQEGYAKRIGVADDSLEVAGAAGRAAAHVRQVQGKLSELSRVLAGAGVGSPRPAEIRDVGGSPHTPRRPGAAEPDMLGVWGAQRPNSVRRAEGEPDNPAVAQLEAIMGKGVRGSPRPSVWRSETEPDNPEIAKLENIMGQVKKRDEAPDPQLEQLNSIVEKLAIVQNSGRKEELSKDSVQTAQKEIARDALPVRPAEEDSAAPGMDAWVTESQTLVSGARFVMELGHDLLVGALLIPRGTPVYGHASLSGERLLVSIQSIAWEGKLYHVSLQVYDQDGLPGIYIPGMQDAESLKESAAQGTSSLGPELLSPTLAGQAAGAGIQAARNLIGRKIRLVRVVVPAGYHLLLMN